MSGPDRVGLSRVVSELRDGFVLRPGATTMALAVEAIANSEGAGAPSPR